MTILELLLAIGAAAVLSTVIAITFVNLMHQYRRTLGSAELISAASMARSKVSAAIERLTAVSELDERGFAFSRETDSLAHRLTLSGTKLLLDNEPVCDNVAKFSAALYPNSAGPARALLWEVETVHGIWFGGGAVVVRR